MNKTIKQKRIKPRIFPNLSKKRLITPTPTPTPPLKISKSNVPPVAPWQVPKLYDPPVSEEGVATGPDLAPLIKRMTEEYPLISKTKNYKDVFIKKNPLISVIITTYNEANNLINLALNSVLNQTYTNLQVIVIADHSTDNTDLEMSKIKDPRVIYRNLPKRTIYPGKIKRDVWLIAGTVPHNIGLSLATGDFITYCDHDDSFTLDRIEKLVKCSQKNHHDFIHHPFYIGTPGHIIATNDSSTLICGKVTTSAIFHHSWFKQIPVDINCWKLEEPGDWNKCKKFKEIGTNIRRYPEVLTFKG